MAENASYFQELERLMREQGVVGEKKGYAHSFTGRDAVTWLSKYVRSG